MAKIRRSGKGGKVYIDVLGGTSYAAVLLARNIKPPGQSKGTVDVGGMEDTVGSGQPGMEEVPTWSFEIIWDPTETQDAALRTAYEADTLLGMKVDMVGSTTAVRPWQGYITKLEPQAFGGNDPVTCLVEGIVAGTGIGADTAS